MAAPGSGAPDSRKRMAVGLAILGALAVVAAVQLAMFADTLLPTEARIAAAAKRLRKAQAELQAAMDERHRLDFRLKEFQDKSALFWIPFRDGNPETAAQPKIEQAAEKAGVTLNSISFVPRPAVPRDGIAVYEMNVDVKGDMERLSLLLFHIDQTRPAYRWASLSIRPDNPKEPEMLRLNGKLKIMAITDDEGVKHLLGKK